jgi:hypothetical protein
MTCFPHVAILAVELSFLRHQAFYATRHWVEVVGEKGRSNQVRVSITLMYNVYRVLHKLLWFRVLPNMLIYSRNKLTVSAN